MPGKTGKKNKTNPKEKTSHDLWESKTNEVEERTFVTTRALLSFGLGGCFGGASNIFFGKDGALFCTKVIEECSTFSGGGRRPFDGS